MKANAYWVKIRKDGEKGDEGMEDMAALVAAAIIANRIAEGWEKAGEDFRGDEYKGGEELLRKVREQTDIMLGALGELEKAGKEIPGEKMTEELNSLLRRSRLFLMNRDIFRTLNYIAAWDGVLTRKEREFIRAVAGYMPEDERALELAEEMEKIMEKEVICEKEGSLVLQQLGYYNEKAAMRYADALIRIGTIMVEEISPETSAAALLGLEIYLTDQLNCGALRKIEEEAER